MADRGATPTLVGAKLARPRVSSAMLRGATLRAFRQATAHRLTLVCAPAGYGKTTAAAEAVDQLGLSPVWYKLDVLDHDPVVFLASLCEALHNVAPDFGEPILERVRAAAELPFPLNEMLAMFVTHAAQSITSELHIVLDDYHEAADSARLNEVLDYLLANLPPNLRFIVLTRYEPNFSKSRMQVNDDVGLVGVDLLRFDAHQARQVLGDRFGHTPSVKSSERLVQLTEGWPASIVLAGFALDWLAQDSLERALADPRLKQDIYSYLAEQVYQREDDATRSFLKQTCCLEHITAELANSLTGADDAHRHLEHLAANRVFTFADDAEEGAYRYHNLFQEFLKQLVVRDSGSQALKTLQLRTAYSLEDAGETEMAVDLLLSLHESEVALSAVAKAGQEGFDRYSADTLESWVARLQPSTAEAAPWLSLLLAHTHLRRSEFSMALSALDDAEVHFRAGNDTLGLYQALCEKECILFWKGDMQAALESCDQAREYAASDEQRIHVLLSGLSAAVQMRDWERIDSVDIDALELRAKMTRVEQARALAVRAHSDYFRGSFKTSEKLFARAVELAPDSVLAASLMEAHAVVLSGLGCSLEALRALCQAAELAEGLGCSHVTPLIWDDIGYNLGCLGYLQDGLRICRLANGHPALRSDPSMHALNLSHLGTLMRRRDSLDEAIAYYAKAVDVGRTSHDPYAELNCSANLLFARRRLEDPRDGLAEVARRASTARLDFVVHKAGLFTAIYDHEHGDARQAVTTLLAHLSRQLELGHLGLLRQELARHHGLAKSLMSKATPTLRAALTDALRARSEDARSILCHLPAGLVSLGLSLSAQPRRSCDILSPGKLCNLTRRELQVLSLMARGLQNKDISEKLFLSPSTVKTHVNHIFAKLEVEDRVHAVLRYQEQFTPGAKS